MQLFDGGLSFNLGASPDETIGPFASVAVLRWFPVAGFARCPAAPKGRSEKKVEQRRGASLPRFSYVIAQAK